MLTLAVVGVTCAAMSACSLLRGRIGLGGTLLLVSAVTPTVFFWLPNCAALVVAMVLLFQRARRGSTARTGGGDLINDNAGSDEHAR